MFPSPFSVLTIFTRRPLNYPPPDIAAIPYDDGGHDDAPCTAGFISLCNGSLFHLNCELVDECWRCGWSEDEHTRPESIVLSPFTRRALADELPAQELSLEPPL